MNREHAQRVVDHLESGKPAMWRVDIAGRTVFVQGEDAYRYLLSVNSQLANMKMALHRIAKQHTHAHLQSIALEALAKVEW